MGLHTVLFSGDHQQTVEALCRDLAFDVIHSELGREQVAPILNSLKEKGNPVAVVGSGMSYAPAIAHADVGVAFGVSPEGPLKTAGVFIEDRDLRKIPWVIKVCRKLRKSIAGSFRGLVVYHAIALGLALLPLMWAPLSSVGGLPAGTLLDLPAVLVLVAGLVPAGFFWVFLRRPRS
jgi:P-type E1-E2 ATPase